MTQLGQVREGLARATVVVGPRSAGGRAAGESIAKMKRERPTAVFASNDVSALGVLTALQSHDIKVPEDISVVGFDDLPAAAQVHPALTSMRQPIEESGARQSTPCWRCWPGSTRPARTSR